MTVTQSLGLNTTTKQYDALQVLGARSVSIWSTTGQFARDSDDQLEQKTSALSKVNFSASRTGNAVEPG